MVAILVIIAADAIAGATKVDCLAKNPKNVM